MKAIVSLIKHRIDDQLLTEYLKSNILCKCVNEKVAITMDSKLIPDVFLEIKQQIWGELV